MRVSEHVVGSKGEGSDVLKCQSLLSGSQRVHDCESYCRDTGAHVSGKAATRKSV